MRRIHAWHIVQGGLTPRVQEHPKVINRLENEIVAMIAKARFWKVGVKPTLEPERSYSVLDVTTA